MPKSIAIIPARGGSQRIPRKNIKLFHGRPILAYSIETAQASALFDRIIVSTDDAQVAELALQFGAEVPFIRPADLSDAHATTMAVMQHAINALRVDGFEFDFACCIYATAPFLQPHFLREGERLLAEQADAMYAFSVTSFAFPVQRALVLNEEGRLDALYPQYRNTRSQDLSEALHDAGQFYWGRCDAWVRGEVIYSPLSLPVKLPRYLTQDIDTVEDWQLAEHLYSALIAAGKISQGAAL
ncbi:pseudaminic acid cytidylyltransferase [Chitinibacter sp. GC72]|uniref:pseudaminic acid cytidylyltransferase n=1 Tax=Chitinibacter sp. GC72 TaxID=1526917 RepID=UPI0012F7B033|nr:pseudaminic acid cytidylyltransferase [Chitinibacter sp. GC72]